MILALLLACGEEARDSGVDTGLCADAPITTWDNFGQGFVTQHCQSCHASGSDNREGAPVEVDFDDEETALGHAARILARVVESQDMPPMGGVTEDDRYRVEVWLSCD